MIEINENKLIELINNALLKNDVEEVYDEMIDDYYLDLINKNPLGLSSEDLEKLKIAIESHSEKEYDCLMEMLFLCKLGKNEIQKKLEEEDKDDQD